MALPGHIGSLLLSAELPAGDMALRIPMTRIALMRCHIG